MNIFESIVSNVWFQRLLWSVIVTLLSLLIYHLISRFLTNKEKKNSKIFSNKKNKTFLRMLRSVTAYALFIMTALVILQIFGVNVSSMLAGVGIASIIVGFALQDALKDIIRGLEIISDSYYDIGDIIKYGDNMGQVLSIGLRTTKIQDINSMNMVSIANRNIDQVEIVSEYIYITVPLPLDLKLTTAESILTEIVKTLKRHKSITSAEYQGVTDFTNSSTNYQIVITCDPMNKLQVRRDSLRVIAAALEANHLTVPHTQVDVHDK